MNKTIIVFLFALLVLSCSKDDDEQELAPLEFAYQFNADAENWQGDFADYPVGQEQFYELEFAYTKLPQPLDNKQGALKLSGNNHSDDLFMFIKRKISGLEPNKQYDVRFNVEIASNVADGTPGVGGSPGESVYIKAGITRIEPIKEVQGTDYRMNIDKANQGSVGKDVVLLGNFANGTNKNEYTLKSLSNAEPFTINADANGELWVLIGTDSGFEANTTIYYNSITIRLE